MFNKMDYIEIIGFAGATCTTISFLPQAVKAWKTKQTRDISLGMYMLLLTGVLLWLAYGILISSLPVIAANAATFILVLSILIFKMKYP